MLRLSSNSDKKVFFFGYNESNTGQFRYNTFEVIQSSNIEYTNSPTTIKIIESGYYHIILSSICFVTNMYSIGFTINGEKYYIATDHTIGDGVEVSRTLVLNKIVYCNKNDIITSYIHTYQSITAKHNTLSIIKL